MIKIDGRTYDVPIISVKRRAEFLYKYAERTQDGILHSEPIGVYFNFDIEAAGVKSKTEYAALWKKLVSLPNIHKVTLWLDDGEYTQEAYFSSIQDEIVTIRGGPNYNKLKFKVISTHPAGAVVF